MFPAFILLFAAAVLVSGVLGFAIGHYSARWSAGEKLARRRKEWLEYFSDGDECGDMGSIVREITKPL